LDLTQEEQERTKDKEIVHNKTCLRRKMKDLSDELKRQEE